MPDLTITLPSLHMMQKEVANSSTRFRVLACGRRWGKTRLGSALCIEVALQGGRSWWIAPSYPVATVGWRLVKRLAMQIPGTQVRQGERLLSFPGGGEVRVRSADNPDSLRGEGLDFAVLDECAFMKEAAWQEAIRPALSDRQGRAMFISTPKGRNWFWRHWQRCQDDGQNEWQGWQLPTSDNPYIPEIEIEAARDGLPERIFQQEYLAMFIDDAGGIFRRVMEAATAERLDYPENNGQYVAGVDVAALVDYTVVTVMDARTRQMVHMDRFNRVDYGVLENRLAAIYDRFDMDAMVIESNSIGQPVIDALMTRQMNIQPFHTVASTKTAIMQNLQTAFEHGAIRILNDPILINELQAYEGKQVGGNWKYSAPDGLHDDCVMSLALAWHGLAHVPSSISEQPEQPSRWRVDNVQQNTGGRWRKY